MESQPSATPEKPPKQACDNCRRRKIKCSRELPCDKCQRLLLSCSYSDVLRRKGPKFRTLYPLAPIHPLASRPRPLTKEWLPPDPAACHLASPTSPPFTVVDAQYPHPDFSESFTRLPPPDLVSSPDSTNSLFDSSTIGALPAPRRLSPPILLAHVNVFFKYLFPIMPIVRQDQLQQDCHQPERLSPQRYAFIASLCAATHIQLKLDGAAPGPDSATATIDGHPMLSGAELLAEAVRARKDYNVVDEINMENLLTSFFLFAAYGNLDRQDQAWFYLSQTMSMVFTLGLQRESTYSKLSVEEAEEKRRVFWLLFVTERGYALQQAKPVMLRNSIHKPQVLCSDDPILAYGFINLINVFEKLSPNLYDWVSAGGGSSADGETPPTSSIQCSLAKQISLEGVSEIQKVDILITQQWLQAMMWKLSMTHATQPGSRDDAVLPFHLPVLVGKAVMGVIAAASQGAVDAHGIGMEQKLYDLGTSVADVSRSLSTKAAHHLAESAVDPRELLWGILTTLSRIRGSQSYLFPALVEQSRGILSFDCSLSISDFLPSFGGPPSISWRTDESGFNLLGISENLHEREEDEAGERIVGGTEISF
ncbi:amylase cluster transcriptional regulator AmyR [Aspergillus bombycis]|uniref:Amylase cluster transcriptional regulator AmyR n=1 Tax=Aspergillus bombycis TaxID=109264 RepID=A0A1F7ZVI5_9EURO|nr:amylase cluster transcriptional regulator AmyR [Aspergillus bombycis]OGM43078.1 amylase cluster transcriptional regulator AmyR [Aspergillus bombycis]